jgi:thiol:disulfide interchange protein DsbD
MIRSRFVPVLALGAALAVAAPATAQDLGLEGDTGAKVTVGEVQPSRTEVPAGTAFEVRIPLSVEPEWHVYSVDEKNGIPTSVKVPEWPEGLSGGATVITPEAHEYGPEGFRQMVHDGEIVVALTVNVAADAEPGARELAGTVHWMACDAGSCLPPAEAAWSVEIEVGEPPKARLGAVVAEPEVVPAGGSTRVRLPVSMADEWHIYGLEHAGVPTKITVEEWPEGLSGGGVTEFPAAKKHDNFGIEELIHEGEVTFSLTVNADAGAAQGPRTLSGVIEWMACDASMCLPVEKVPFTVALSVGPADAAGAVVAADSGPADIAPVADDEFRGGITLDLILQAMILGFITILTPCVFPMLPITVSFFSKQEGPALPRSLVYGAGWIFTIVGIGLIFKSTLDVFARGDLFNLAVGILFFVLALSLFGLFDLRLPGFLSDWSTKKSASGGYVGAFFMAVTIALTSFSCSVPFLAIMFERFEGGQYGVALVGLTVYAMTLAAPFVLCSLFPALLRSMPRAGSWMNAIKVTMGFVELALAFKFLRTVDLNNDWGFLSRDLVLAIWVACCIGAALYLFGYLVLPHDTKTESIGVVRLLFAILFLSLGFFFLPGVFGRPLPPTIDAFLQTMPHELASAGPLRGGGGGSDGGAAHEELAWVKNDWEGTLERARERGVPVLFDFTGFG